MSRLATLILTAVYAALTATDPDRKKARASRLARARRAAADLSSRLLWATHLVWFYNIGPGRDVGQVGAELRAMAKDRPLVILLVEAIGYGDLPDLPGYRKIRDRSTESRANVAGYGRTTGRHRVADVVWQRLHRTWSKWNGPGQHPGRTMLRWRQDRMPVAVHHQPPKGTDNVAATQAEGFNVMRAFLSPGKGPLGRYRPRLLGVDINATGSDPRGAAALARSVGGQYVGNGVDVLAARGQIRFVSHSYEDRVNGVEMRTDHSRGALRAQVRIARWWVAAPKAEKSGK